MRGGNGAQRTQGRKMGRKFKLADGQKDKMDASKVLQYHRVLGTTEGRATHRDSNQKLQQENWRFCLLDAEESGLISPSHAPPSVTMAVWTKSHQETLEDGREHKSGSCQWNVIIWKCPYSSSFRIQTFFLEQLSHHLSITTATALIIKVKSALWGVSSFQVSLCVNGVFPHKVRLNRFRRNNAVLLLQLSFLLFIRISAFLYVFLEAFELYCSRRT